MLLNYHEIGTGSDFTSLIEDCYHKVAEIYGVWPQNIRAASMRGLVGAVETLGSMSQIDALLALQLPVIASISYGTGELDGAPMDSTSGHLVVVTGTSASEITVRDPAAESDADTHRNYDRSQFIKSWLSHGGIVYLLCPF